MLTEVMSGLGDEFAYTQDRIARETKLETATQRRSVRRMATTTICGSRQTIRSA